MKVIKLREIVTLCCLSAGAVHVGAQEGMAVPEWDVSYSATALWESRYISEGRDNLDDGGLFSVEGAAEFKGLAAGLWYAVADTVSYDELNLFIQYGLEWGAVAMSGGYTRLEFLKDDGFDNEIYAGLALTALPYLVPAVDYVYSTEAEGSFVELSVGVPVKFFRGRLVLNPYILEGFDLGYASDEYDGFNNFQVGVGIDYNLTEELCLVGSVNRSWANQDLRQEGGGDENWISLGIAAAF